MGGRAKFECREVLSLKELQGDVLKMDIEGGEHKIFAQANDGDITKFGEIILEYHGGAGNLKARLENLSFEVALFHPTFNGRNGILHARKKTPPNRP